MIGDRIAVSHHIFSVVTTKVFVSLGWNGESFEIGHDSSLVEFYNEILQFWTSCLLFQLQEQELMPLTSEIYHYSAIPFEQRSSIIEFCLFVGNLCLSVMEGGNKQSMQYANKVFSRHVALLSLCLGNLPNIFDPHSLDRGKYRNNVTLS